MAFENLYRSFCQIPSVVVWRYKLDCAVLSYFHYYLAGVLLSIRCVIGAMIGGPELDFSSSVTIFPIFGLTAVLEILSFPALASGDNIAD